MIYTVTFNPSLDYIVSVDDFKLGLTLKYEIPFYERVLKICLYCYRGAKDKNFAPLCFL